MTVQELLSGSMAPLTAHLVQTPLPGPDPTQQNSVSDRRALLEDSVEQAQVPLCAALLQHQGSVVVRSRAGWPLLLLLLCDSAKVGRLGCEVWQGIPPNVVSVRR